MKKLSGFSLMEMMVVLLIVSVVAAASAPMINKKMVTAASDKSPWLWLGNSGDIGYNVASGDIAAVIGRQNMPNIDAVPRLYIDSDTPDTRPQITFGNGGNNPVHFRVGDGGIAITNDLENNAQINNSIVIGVNATAGDDNSVAIGRSANANLNSVAIGNDANNGQSDSIAIGNRARANNVNSIAIGTPLNEGTPVSASADDTIAIGHGATANQMCAIAIGGSGNEQAFEGQVVPQATARYAIAIGARTLASRDSSIAIGKDASTTTGASNDVNSSGSDMGDSGNSIAIGSRAKAGHKQAISIGTNAETGGYYSIAIGANAKATKRDAIAIGSAGGANDQLTRANGERSVAIGWNAKVLEGHDNSVAIGKEATTTDKDQIVLGGDNTTVVIPGNLIIGSSTHPSGYLAVTGNIASGGWIMGKTLMGQNVYADSSENEIANLIEFSPAIDITHDAGSYDWTNRKNYKDYDAWAKMKETKTSDRRLKNVGKAFIGGLEEIKKLEVFNYTYKKDPNKTPRVGVMAQDLQKIFPNAVTKGDDGFLRIRMEDMFYAVVNAIKELDAKIEKLRQEEILTLRNDIEKLKKENVELKKQNESFEKRLEKLEKKTK